jgi:hypothetical protein
MDKKQLGITGLETGEVIRELTDNEQLKITTKKQLMNYHQQKKSFLKLFKISIKDIIHFNLSKVEYNTLFLLLDLLPYGSQIIQIDGVPANRMMLSKKIYINYDKLGRHMKKLEKCNVIKKDGIGQKSHFYVNPNFITFGNKISDRAFELFNLGSNNPIC